MKTKKIFTYLFVLLLIQTLLTGCTSESPTGLDDEVIKIGGNFELTGVVAEYGKMGEKGAKLAIKEANATGGVLGMQIEYVGADNKSEAVESAVATTKLATQDNVIGIIGPMTAGKTKAAIPVITEYKIPLVTPTGFDATLTVTEAGVLNEWVFRTCFVDYFQGEVAANFAMDTLGASKAALVIDQKGNYAKGLAQSFKETFEKAGKEVVASEQYVAGRDTDFRDILTNIKKEKPDIIFIPGYYNEAGMIIKQARDAKIDVAILGGDGWGIGPIVDIAGKEAMNNTYYVDHVAADDPALAEFAATFKAEYNQQADTFAVLGYDAAKLLIAAIEKANSTDPGAIRLALETINGFLGISGEINVDSATHNPQKSAPILKFVDGTKIFAARVDPK